MASAPFDVAMVGGGHNGLVCAAYLARAGARVIVLERRAVVGGAAVTEEFHPGFRNSLASYTVSLLHPRIVRELRLAEHGLEIVLRPFSNFLPLPDGNYLRTGATPAETRAEVARFSRRDAERLPAFLAMLESGASLLRDLVLEAPPNAGGGLRDVLRALALGNRVRRRPLAEQRDVLELFTRSAGDLLDAWFENEAVKALFAFDAVVGNFVSPYAPGSAYVLLHHVFGEANGRRGAWGHALGGMGAITEAMRRECEVRGVTIRTGTAVAEILHDGDRARGVRLADGAVITARAVAANVHPRMLFTELVDAAGIDPDFDARIRRHRNGSGSFRMNVALAQLPRLRSAPADDPTLGTRSGIILAPSLRYLEDAWIDARQRGFSREPIVEMLIPSTVDDSLAPPGRHVASLFCQHFDPRPEAAGGWDHLKDDAVEAILATVEASAPGFRAAIVGQQVLSPLDLERELGLVDGDIFHGALGLDQLFSARPVLGFASYRTPVRGLYLCGAGAHPGGGVTGAPGYNAANVIRRDLRLRQTR